jgi:hypothetical protein
MFQGADFIHEPTMQGNILVMDIAVDAGDQRGKSAPFKVNGQRTTY